MDLPERIGLSVFGFFQRGVAAVGDFTTDTISSISTLRRLRQDYDALLKKTGDYERIEREYADLLAENERLRTQLGFRAESGGQKIAARIVGKDPGNLWSTLTIDKGLGDGVRKNMPVSAWQNGVQGLVGRVLEAGQGVSVVVPLYDATSYVAARIAKSRYEGLLVGSGSEEDPLVLRYVRKRARDETQAGDLIVSSGLDSLYPPDLALGRISRIRELAYQTSLDIDVEPILDFTRLEYVFVDTGLAPAGEPGTPQGEEAQP
jgi:rod shape-determining protein MreC